MNRRDYFYQNKRPWDYAGGRKLITDPMYGMVDDRDSAFSRWQRDSDAGSNRCCNREECDCYEVKRSLNVPWLEWVQLLWVSEPPWQILLITSASRWRQTVNRDKTFMRSTSEPRDNIALFLCKTRLTIIWNDIWNKAFDDLPCIGCNHGDAAN